jgi:hypothetical protein
MLNDIALFTLSNPVKLNNSIQIACLPKYSTAFPSYNTAAFASGWVFNTLDLKLIFSSRKIFIHRELRVQVEQFHQY